MKILRFNLIAFALLLLTSAQALAQCPMCKAAVESNAGGKPDPMAQGLNNGILYLFVLPYSMVMVLAAVFFYYRRKHKKAEAEAALSPES